MTKPNPRAPPVTTATRSWRENVGNVGPRTGLSFRILSSSGYSKLISLSVREALPSCGPAETPVAAVLALWYGSSCSSRSPVEERGRERWWKNGGVNVGLDNLTRGLIPLAIRTTHCLVAISQRRGGVWKERVEPRCQRKLLRGD